MTILICGANGRTAGFVIDALLKKDALLHLRLLVHSSSSIKSLRERYPSANFENHVGDFLDRKSLMEAMRDVDIVFYNSPPLHSQETAMGISVIKAAQECNVKHFVYASVLHPLRTKLLNHKVKLGVEEYLIESRLDYTILQPTHFMQNVPLSAILASPNPQLSIPYSPQTLQGFVSLEDVAEVSAMVLLDPKPHNRARYELLGDNRSYADATLDLSKACGREISCKQIGLDEAAKQFQASGVGVDEWGEDAIQRMFFYYDRWGLTGNTNILAWLLGRKPIDWPSHVRKEIEASKAKAGLEK